MKRQVPKSGFRPHVPPLTHECPYPECRERIPLRLFACRDHWYALPREIRDDVWSAYRRHGVGSAELAHAHDEARKAWSA